MHHYINLRGEASLYLRLSDYFSEIGSTTKAKRESLVVVRFGQQKAGFIVDKLHGEHQTVSKPLGKVLKKNGWFNGYNRYE